MTPNRFHPTAPSPILDARAGETIGRAAEILRNGGVIALPTDTVYGFAAALDQPAALARLFAMKQRSAAKAIPVLIGSRAVAHKIAIEFPTAAVLLADVYWPGALTIIAPARAHLPREVTSLDEDGVTTVALRIPDNDVALEIIAAAGGALAVTSANRSGDEPALAAAEIAATGTAAPDVIVDGGPARSGRPSTIVRIKRDTFDILREGAIPAVNISRILGDRAAGTGSGGQGAV